MKSQALLSLSLLTLLTLFCNAETQPVWDDTLNFEDIEYRLLHEPISETRSMHTFLKKSGKIPSGTHPIKLVILESGLKAVFKEPGACYGEVAAYRAAKALGMRLVPPTVFREINGRMGSLQFYVESPIDLMKSRQDYHRKLDHKTVTDEQLFNYLLCRWDIHAGNQMLSKEGSRYYLALIDNAGVRSLIHNTKNKVKTLHPSTFKKLEEFDHRTLENVWHEYLQVKKDRCTILIDRILERKGLLLAGTQQAKHSDA